MELRKIQFRTTVYENNSRHHSVYLEPENKMHVINNFLITYSTSSSVKRLITDLNSAIQFAKPETREVTINESHIYIDSEKAIFDMELVTQLEPIEIEIYSAIEFFKLYKEYLKRYENNKIPGLQPTSELKDVEWDYISGWEIKGVLEPKHIIKWAYADNGYFSDQDEDLMMHRPELIPIMHELMLDPNSKRKKGLFKTLIAYANEAFGRMNNQMAQSEFRSIMKVNSNDVKQQELIKRLSEIIEINDSI